jgi:hypothetical protein
VATMDEHWRPRRFISWKVFDERVQRDSRRHMDFHVPARQALQGVQIGQLDDPRTGADVRHRHARRTPRCAALRADHVCACSNARADS